MRAAIVAGLEVLATFNENRDAKRVEEFLPAYGQRTIYNQAQLVGGRAVLHAVFVQLREPPAGLREFIRGRNGLGFEDHARPVRPRRPKVNCAGNLRNVPTPEGGRH
jgi:hypothetical protein